MFEFTLKLIWIILSIFLIFIIFSRVPKNQGLTSFATKSDLLGSPNSTESFLNNLAIASIFYAIGFLILSYLEGPPIVRGLMFCYAVNTAIVWRITTFWKISIHMIGLGGPIVALWLSGFEYPLAMGLALILVATSRLLLKAHTISQVIAGTFLAMGLAYFELTYLFL